MNAIDSPENAVTLDVITPTLDEDVPTAESALLDRLRRGEPDAFDALVREHGGHLLAVARRLLRHDEDARDAVQEAFLLAFRGLPAFAGRCRLSTWLHRITVNAALMKLRTRSRKPETQLDDLLPDYLPDGHHVTQFTEWTLSPSQHMLRAERAPRCAPQSTGCPLVPRGAAPPRHRGTRHDRGGQDARDQHQRREGDPAPPRATGAQDSAGTNLRRTRDGAAGRRARSVAAAM